ncbi:MAG: ATP-binding cassette domain-containing protein, partial [Mangrovicoccus sp.]
MTTPAISVTKVSKRFGDTLVLKDIDLQVQKGDVTCLIGPSGSGKSTLLRCMAFLEEVSAGSILIEGEALGFVEKGGKRQRQTAAELRATRS